VNTVERPETTSHGSRNRAVDLLRAASIVVVVMGHWLMAAPEWVDGRLAVGGLVTDVVWVQAVTWVLQVMPVFFFVGGFANAAAWRSARRTATPYPRWLRTRLRRLVLPVVPLLATWAGIGWLAWELGVDPSIITLGSQAALLPTWFLASYILIVTTAPLALAWWERWGWWAPVTTAAAAIAVDVTLIRGDVDAIGYLNYALVWGTVHMLGYAWADGRVGGLRTRLGLATGGLAATAGLVALGPYPLAMVGVDATEIANSLPPKITLVTLAAFQFGLVMAVEPWLRRTMEQSRLWRWVVRVNGSIMSVFVWHQTVMILLLGLAMLVGGWGLGLAVNSAGWWWTRPVWLALLAGLTLPVLVLVSRFERPAQDRRPTPAAWRPLLAAAAVCGGLGLLAKNGVVTAEGLNWVALGLPLVGMVVGGVIGAGPDDSDSNSAGRRSGARRVLAAGGRPVGPDQHRRPGVGRLPG
jgi:hypothetical protein